MRADAAKRRTAIVDAARAQFALHGEEVALESIAATAGVGIATLYRNFPSRSDLADEVTLAILGDMRSAAAEAVDSFPAEPGRAWERCVLRLVGLDLGALTAALARLAAGELSGPVRSAQNLTQIALEELLSAARSAGLVRADLTVLELVLAIGMITRPQPEPIRAAAPDLVPRLTTILLAGMRPTP